MSTIAFNAITYANKLKKAGMEPKVADVMAEEMSTIMDLMLVTKKDLKETECVLKRELTESERSVKATIRELELRMIIKLG